MAFFDLMYCKYTVEYTYPGVKWFAVAVGTVDSSDILALYSRVEYISYPGVKGFAVGVGTVDSSDILALYSGQNTFSSSNVRKKHSRKHLK